MEVTLKVVSGRHAGQQFAVPVPKFIIGRSEDCHLRPHSDLVSRHHCAILIDNEKVAVRDFNSRNGTFVNGEKVVGERALKTGDQLSIGQLVLEINAKPSEKPKPVSVAKHPKVQSVADAAARTVAKESRDDDTSISQWLSEDTSINQIPSDTKANDLNSTTQITPQQQEELAALIEGQTAHKTSDSKVPSGPKKIPPGKLPPIPSVPQSKDSREAASEMLKKILRSR
ncbi:MAG: FHA domain-containing protein [Planctomycetota bacterium]|nr:FHA domain-containing protein [Planctomycetota bacterium]